MAIFNSLLDGILLVPLILGAQETRSLITYNGGGGGGGPCLLGSHSVIGIENLYIYGTQADCVHVSWV